MGSNRRSNDRDDADLSLFGAALTRHPTGRVRRGLDTDARAAAGAGARIPAAGLAALRSLADQIDQLERMLRNPAAGAYDRVPLAGLVREFRETYDTVFTANATEDPFSRALADFIAADRGAQVGDPAGPDAPE
jgi:hypothetical protein